MCQVDFVFSFFDLSQRVVLGGKSSFYTEFLYNLQCLFGQLWISYLRRKKGLAVGIFLIVKENHAVNVCGIWLIFWKKTPILGLYRTLFERTHIRNGIFFPLSFSFFAVSWCLALSRRWMVKKVVSNWTITRHWLDTNSPSCSPFTAHQDQCSRKLNSC